MTNARLSGHLCVAVVVCSLATGLPQARALDLSTDDGLTLRLDDATGAIRRVVVDERELPLIEGVAGGLWYREWRYVEPEAQEPLASVGFESAEGWVKVAGADWESDEPVGAELRADGGALGSRSYVRLGEGEKYGHGVGFEEHLPVEPGKTFEISWQGRSPSGTDTYIIYLRLYDAQGREVTEATAPPKGWRYSIYTHTHYHYPMGVPGAGKWAKVSRKYRVPDGIASLRVALALWRGEYADGDCFEVLEAGGVAPLEPRALRASVTAAGEGKGCRQHVRLPDEQLEFDLTYTVQADHIRVEGHVQDTSVPPRGRAIQVRYSLPVQAEGWWWHDDIRTRRTIEANGSYSTDFQLLGHSISTYPFSCISDDRTGLAMGAPLNHPLMECRSYRPGEGYRLSLDLGLSPHTRDIGPGRATFAFVIYKTAEPLWGFRSAAAKYYEISPEFFTKRAAREGCWLYPVRPDEIPQLEDFGFAFWEGYSSKQEVRDVARANGIYILSYIEPCGLRQWFPELEAGPEMYSYEECLAKLRQLAVDKESTAKWRGGPRWEVAQAILNSLPEKADGTAPFQASKEYDNWAQWWFTNPSPYLAEPNRGGTCWEYEIEPRLAHADGIYVDSVSIGSTTNYENYREEHVARARGPLTFSFETGRPCLPGVASYHDFLKWMADRLHGQDKLVMLNIFPLAYRFYAHLGDVLGSEVGSSGSERHLATVESEAWSCLRRTYAYRKPTTNLLQEGSWTRLPPALTREQIEQYIKHETFYGFYPGVATTGGEEKPGYKGWKRYFRSPEQFERDRDLFKKYIPLIRRVNEAGWEPVTHARASDPDVLIERFGSWRKGDLHFTLRNVAAEAKTATVRLELAGLGATARDLGAVVVTDLVSGVNLPVKRVGEGESVEFDISLEPADTAVVAMTDGG